MMSMQLFKLSRTKLEDKLTSSNEICANLITKMKKTQNKSKNYYQKTIKTMKIKKTIQEIKKLKKWIQNNFILPNFARNQSRSPITSKTSFS